MSSYEESEDDNYSEGSIPKKRTKRQSKKKKASKKRFSKSQFLDIQAESGDEEESSVDSEFRDEKDEAEHLLQKIRKRESVLDTMDPDAIARKYDERVKLSMQTLPKEISHIAKQRELPSIDDPKLWQVGCRKGKGKEAVINLLQKAIHKQSENDPVKIFSAFASSHVKDYIYVEAYSKIDVVYAIRGMHMLNEMRVNLVPIDEMVEVFSMDKAKKVNLKKGTFVRIRSGDYKGDLAQVVNVEEHRGRAMIRVVPRLEKTGNKKIRAPAKLFNHDDYRDAEKKRDSSEQGFFYYCWNGMQFYSGFLLKFMSLRSLQISNVNPSLAEFQIFQTTHNNDIEEDAPAIQGRKIQFIQGDKVKVIKGDVKGLAGTVHTSSDGVVFIIPHIEDLCESKYEFPVEDLCKFFEDGDHVKVIAGRYAGITGMIISTTDNSAEILCDVSKNVITALCNDLKLSDEVSSGLSITTDYKIYDIVTLTNDNAFGIVVKVDSEFVTTILTSGETRNIWFHEISKKFIPKRASALDRDQNSLIEGDMVKISFSRSPYYNKCGAIKNSLRGVLFINVLGEGQFGIVPIKANYCLLLGTESKPLEQGEARKSDVVGKMVRIKTGPYRGYTGKVTELNNSKARIEMSTLSKYFTVDIEACEILKSGEEVISIQKPDVTRTPAAVHSPGYEISTPAQDLSLPWDTPRGDHYWPKSPSVPRNYRN